MEFVCREPGFPALHPATRISPRQRQGMILRTVIPLLLGVDPMHQEQHLAMSHAAKDAALAREVACLLRRDRSVRLLSGGRFEIHTQSVDAQTVGDIIRYDFKLYCLPFFQSDFRGDESVARSMDFNGRTGLRLQAASSGNS